MNSGTEDEIANWLQTEFEKHLNKGRQPFNLLINAVWFLSVENSYQGLTKFLDHLATLDGVYVVSNKQLLDWMRNPQPIENYSPVASEQAADCNKSLCPLDFQGETRYMGACAACPDIYPWVGNPLGQKPEQK